MTILIPSPPKNVPSDIHKWMQDVKFALEKSHVIRAGVPISAPQTGDMIYKSPLAWARLAAGSAGQVLTQSTSTAPSWAYVSSLFNAGTGISITGTSTLSINAAITGGEGIDFSGTATRTGNVRLVAGTGISITGTATKTIAATGAATTTFTANLLFGGSNPGMVYSLRASVYAENGSVVFARGQFILSTKGSGTGVASITGFPQNALGNSVGHLSLAAGGTAWPSNAHILTNGTSLLLRYDNGTSAQDITNAHFTDTTNLVWTVTFDK